jgi:hypothetical protein
LLFNLNFHNFQKTSWERPAYGDDEAAAIAKQQAMHARAAGFFLKNSLLQNNFRIPKCCPESWRL